MEITTEPLEFYQFPNSILWSVGIKLVDVHPQSFISPKRFRQIIPSSSRG